MRPNVFKWINNHDYKYDILVFHNKSYFIPYDYSKIYELYVNSPCSHYLKAKEVCCGNFLKDKNGEYVEIPKIVKRIIKDRYKLAIE